MSETIHVDECILAKCRQLLMEDNGVEKMFVSLRKKGISKAQSCQIYSALANINLGEAQEIIHVSKAWEDVRSRDEKLQDTLWDVLEELGEKDSC